MEHNIDKEIKKKLENRLLEPTSLAWDKLNNMLEQKDKKSKKAFPFYWIAACFVILLGVFQFFTVQNQGALIESNNKLSEQEYKNGIKKMSASSNTQIDGIKVTDDFKKGIVKISNNNHVKRNSKKKDQELSIINDIKSIEKQQENLVTHQKINKSSKLDIEVDFLLSNALTSLENNRPQVQKQKLFYEVNPNTLLTDVEEELDLSFKEKIFKKITQEFKKTKTAFAKRND